MVLGRKYYVSAGAASHSTIVLKLLFLNIVHTVLPINGPRMVDNEQLQSIVVLE